MNSDEIIEMLAELGGDRMTTLRRLKELNVMGWREDVNTTSRGNLAGCCLFAEYFKRRVKNVSVDGRYVRYLTTAGIRVEKVLPPHIREIISDFDARKLPAEFYFDAAMAPAHRPKPVINWDDL